MEKLKLSFFQNMLELNPQEHVWKEGRNKVTNNKFIENIDKATDEFVDYLNTTRFNYSLLEFRCLDSDVGV